MAKAVQLPFQSYFAHMSTPQIIAIVAASENHVIGKDQDIPWDLPDDMRFFMRSTNGHPVIMGRKNFQTLPKPLRNRTNIVMTRDPFFLASGAVVVHSREEALAIAQESPGAEKIWIIGGEDIYRLFWDDLDLIYLTVVHAQIEGDVCFPEMDENEWDLIHSDFHPTDDRHEHSFTFKTFRRKEKA